MLMQSARITSKSDDLLSDLNFFRTAVFNNELFSTITTSSSSSSPPQAPSLKIIYEHSSTCFHSPAPESLILSKSAIHLLLAHDLARLTQLREQYTKYEDPEDIIEHAKLLKEVKTNYLSRGVYLKRCNGQFVDALGEVIDETTAVELNVGNDGSLKGQEHAAEDNYETSATAAHVQVEAESLLDAPMTSSTIIDDADGGLMEKAANFTQVDEVSDNCSGIIITAATTPASSVLISSISRAATATPAHASDVAAPSHSFFPFDGSVNIPITAVKPSSPTNNTTSHAIEATASTTTNNNPQTKEEAQKPAPAIPFLALQQREMLLRAGHMGDEDLILTCWAVNGQVEHNIAAAVKNRNRNENQRSGAMRVRVRSEELGWRMMQS